MAKLAVYAQYQANQQNSVKKAGMFWKEGLLDGRSQ
jgi:hypothetical protein